MDVRLMRTLVYKRTHSGDPDPATGVFGIHDCMATVRGRSFDAVIGIGGIGQEPHRCGIARKLTWVGVGPHRTGDSHRPLVAFDHFLYYGEDGPLFEALAPALAGHIYGRGVRTIMDKLSDQERMEIVGILRTALTAPASPSLTQHAVDQPSRSGHLPADDGGVCGPLSAFSAVKSLRSTKC